VSRPVALLLVLVRRTCELMLSMPFVPQGAQTTEVLSASSCWSVGGVRRHPFAKERLQAWRTYLSSLTREVVGRLERTGDTFLDGRVATVVRGQDGVLETSRVRDVNVELAVLALLGDGDTGANRGDVRVEDERHDGPVAADLRAHGALGATGSSIADATDGDLYCVSRMF
jgi:hypothetical protein